MIACHCYQYNCAAFKKSGCSRLHLFYSEYSDQRVELDDLLTQTTL